MNGWHGKKSLFADVERTATNEIPLLVAKARADSSPLTVDLSAGTFKDENGNEYVPAVVRQVEQIIASDPGLSHLYLLPLGLTEFCTGITALLMGKDNVAVAAGRAFGIQTVSSTAGLRLACEFVSRILCIRTSYMSSPSWGNHDLILSHSGFPDSQRRRYRYWDSRTRGLDFRGMMEDLCHADPGSLIFLQVSGHNPTGVDPDREQWQEIAAVVRDRRLLPLFDCAYQGLATGDLDEDTYPVRLFAELGIDFFCSFSCSKMFGLYSERVGLLLVHTSDTNKVMAIRDQMTVLVTAANLNPPAHGARIVARILNCPDLRDQWCRQLQTMALRITSVRKMLHSALRKRLSNGTSGSWDHVMRQKGMFCYTGLSKNQVSFLVNECHIYLTCNGRISLCGLNEANVDYVAACFVQAIQRFPS